MKALTPRFSLLSLCALLSTASLAHASTVLINNTFDTAAELADWDAITGYDSTAINTNNEFGTGNSMAGNVNASVNLLVVNFDSQVNLASIGDNITISFDYKWQATGVNTDFAPAFGFYNASETPANYQDDFGYMTRNVGSSMGLYYENGTNNYTLAGTDIVGAQDSFSGAYDGGARTFTMTVTRIADTNSNSIDDLQVDFTLYNPGTDTSRSLSAVYTDGEMNYDYFAIRSRNTNFYMDNVLATTSVPEPSTSALGLAAFAGILLFIQRLRTRR